MAAGRPLASFDHGRERLGTQMLAPDFVNRVREVLARNRLPAPPRLEITERLVVSDAPWSATESTSSVNSACASLSTISAPALLPRLLRALPVDILKIDQNFVKPRGVDARAGALLKSIVAIADALQLGVVVEGVETFDQVGILTALGCEVAQGFYFARPGPASAITEMLALNALQLHLDHLEPSDGQA